MFKTGINDASSVIVKTLKAWSEHMNQIDGRGAN